MKPSESYCTSQQAHSYSQKQRHHPVSANSPPTVRQDIPIPALQLMRAAYLIQYSLSRLQAEMVCII
jgi:hypothetical protein